MPIEVSLNGQPIGYCDDSFYAIGIGSERRNEIVIHAQDGSGVHPYHCTLFYTGSTYRLEMPPSYQVYLDGDPVKGGHQFTLDRNEKVDLSIGGPPDPHGLKPPPTVTLEYKDKSGLRPLSKKLNRQPWRLPILVLGAAIIAVAGAGIGISMYFAEQERVQNARIETARALFESGVPDQAALKDLLRQTIVRVGIEKDGGFEPFGTGWIWRDKEGDATRLVTNRHVFDAINTCVEATAVDANACRNKNHGCPAVKYVDPATSTPQILPLVAACKDDPDYLQPHKLEARLHGDYDPFEEIFQPPRNDNDIPNIYDVAVVDWPAQWTGPTLAIAARDKLGLIANGVATVGYPTEGEGPAAAIAMTPTFRPTSIGRTSDPYGLPGSEEYFLILSGIEVQGGESGGPVINQEGEVVGMLFGAYFTRSPVEGQTERWSFGNKTRALDARLIREVVGGKEDAIGQKRRDSWLNGRGLLEKNYHDRLVGMQVAESCGAADAKAVMIGQPREITTDLKMASGTTADKRPPAGFEPRHAHFGSFDLPRDPTFDREKIQSVVVVISSMEDRESPVFVQMKRLAAGAAQPGPDRRSNSTMTTLTSVKDDVIFGPNESVTYSYEIYSQKKTTYSVEVYRIACERKS